MPRFDNIFSRTLLFGTLVLSILLPSQLEAAKCEVNLLAAALGISQGVKVTAPEWTTVSIANEGSDISGRLEIAKHILEIQQRIIELGNLNKRVAIQVAFQEFEGEVPTGKLVKKFEFDGNTSAPLILQFLNLLPESIGPEIGEDEFSDLMTTADEKATENTSFEYRIRRHSPSRLQVFAIACVKRTCRVIGYGLAAVSFVAVGTSFNLFIPDQLPLIFSQLSPPPVIERVENITKPNGSLSKKDTPAPKSTSDIDEADLVPLPVPLNSIEPSDVSTPSVQVASEEIPISKPQVSTPAAPEKVERKLVSIKYSTRNGRSVQARASYAANAISSIDNLDENTYFSLELIDRNGVRRSFSTEPKAATLENKNQAIYFIMGSF